MQTLESGRDPSMEVPLAHDKAFSRTPHQVSVCESQESNPLFFHAVAPPSWSSRGAGKQCRLAHVAKSKHQTSAALRLLGSFHCLHRLHRLHRFHRLHWCLRFHMSERKGCRKACFLALKSIKTNTSKANSISVPTTSLSFMCSVLSSTQDR